MRGDVVRGHLDLLLLAVLSRSPAHGYAIIQELKRGAFDLPEGTIYPALQRLERDGLVSSAWTVASGRRRRVYTVTAAGRSALRVQKLEWRNFSRALDTVLR